MHARWAMQGEQAAAQCCDGRTPLCPLSLPPSLFVPPRAPLALIACSGDRWVSAMPSPLSGSACS